MVNEAPSGDTLRLQGSVGQSLLDIYPAFIKQAPYTLRRRFGMSLMQGQDTAQEAFLMTARACLAGQATPSNLKGYLFAAAYNLAVSALRRVPEVSVGGVELDQLRERQPPRTGQDLRVLHELVVPAIEDMAPGTRKRIVELQAGGLEDQEIAEALGISLNNLRVQRHKAVVELRRKLNAHSYPHRRKAIAVRGKGIT